MSDSPIDIKKKPSLLWKACVILCVPLFVALLCVVVFQSFKERHEIVTECITIRHPSIQRYKTERALEIERRLKALTELAEKEKTEEGVPAE